MQAEEKTVNTLSVIFAEEYIEKIFYFCLRKTGSKEQADDLTQDIALNVLSALGKGIRPKEFSAWVWKIARNRYSVWAEKKRRKAETFTDEDIVDCNVEDNADGILEVLVRQEQLALLRRELAFISKEYREIIVAHYIGDKSIREIALSLSLSEAAVKQRLCRGRKILKEGMDMAKEFGIRSYSPEEVYFTTNCRRRGEMNQPYSIFEHRLYKNIFLEAYGNPSSAEALSLALGVAAPYMEDELNLLTRETLLKKNGEKYETAFPIISTKVQKQAYELCLSRVTRISEVLTAFVDVLNSVFERMGFDWYGKYQDYESAKWSLLMLVFDYFEFEETKQIGITQRPDGGEWDIIGRQAYDANERCFVGKHVSDFGFSQFRYEFDGIDARTPAWLNEAESRTLCSLVKDNDYAADESLLLSLEKHGYVCRGKSGYVPQILVIDAEKVKEMAECMNEDIRSEIEKLGQDAKSAMRKLQGEVAEIVKRDIPKSLANERRLVALAVESCCMYRGDILLCALDSGWLKPAESLNRAIGAHMVIQS